MAELVTAEQTPEVTLIVYVSVLPIVAGTVMGRLFVVPAVAAEFFVHAMVLFVPPVTVADSVVFLLAQSVIFAMLIVAFVSTFTVKLSVIVTGLVLCSNPK